MPRPASPLASPFFAIPLCYLSFGCAIFLYFSLRVRCGALRLGLSTQFITRPEPRRNQKCKVSRLLHCIMSSSTAQLDSSMPRTAAGQEAIVQKTLPLRACYTHLPPPLHLNAIIKWREGGMCWQFAMHNVLRGTTNGITYSEACRRENYKIN